MTTSERDSWFLTISFWILPQCSRFITRTRVTRVLSISSTLNSHAPGIIRWKDFAVDDSDSLTTLPVAE
jgi:hypothetical protein